MRVALLTGGGDCPGLNAVIYAAVRKGINHYGDEFIGFLNGWKGVLENQFIPLTQATCSGGLGSNCRPGTTTPCWRFLGDWRIRPGATMAGGAL